MKCWSEDMAQETGKSRTDWENEGLLAIMERFVEQNDSVYCVTTHVADTLEIPRKEAEERVNAALKIIEESNKKAHQNDIQADGRDEFAAIVRSMRKADLSNEKIAELIGRNIDDVDSVE